MTLTKALVLATLLMVPAYSETKTDNTVRLTMPNVQAALNGFMNFGELLTANPELRKQVKEVEKSFPDDTTGDKKFGLLLAKMSEKDSRVSSAFSKADVTPKDAADTLQMLMAAAFGDAMLKPGQPIPKDMDPLIADNLKFYRQHKEELAPQLQKFQGLTEKLNESDDK